MGSSRQGRKGCGRSHRRHLGSVEAGDPRRELAQPSQVREHLQQAVEGKRTTLARRGGHLATAHILKHHVQVATVLRGRGPTAATPIQPRAGARGARQVTTDAAARRRLGWGTWKAATASTLKGCWMPNSTSRSATMWSACDTRAERRPADAETLACSPEPRPARRH